MLVLNRREVEALLDPERLVEALALAMADLSAGAASMPPRIAATVPEPGGFLMAMPAYLPSAPALAAKLVSLFPSNAALGLSTHPAIVLVFDSATGYPVAVMDGEPITAARTAAGSLLATRLLARPESAVLAVIGTGTQARAHLRVLGRWPCLRQVRLAGRDEAKAGQLAEEIAGELGRPIEVAPSYREALAGADIVCATTHSPEPVVRREWLTPGVHVNSVGFNPAGPEVDAATVQEALVVVESRQTALAPYPAGANDLTWPIREGLITAEHIHAELGELVAGTRSGRTSADQITLYKSVGVAVQDAATAALVLAAARERGLGTEVKLSG